MDKINSLFTIGNVNEDNAQKIFTDIATELFEHCFIKQGEAVKYKFLEVEFYFWSEAHKDNKLDNEGKKEVPFVYPRNNTQPAQYLVHASGMDLCFKSDNGYGGILIRSLLRIEGKEQSVVTGPWDCCYALINYMGGSENVFSKLTYGEEKDTKVELETAIRHNVPVGSSMKNAPYCFYNKKYMHKSGKWGFEDVELKRYNPSTRKSVANTYSIKPWNR